MANISYEEYQKQQAARQAAGNKGGERKPVHFMKEFLENDGDQVVVRFPYTSPSDFVFESVHNVKGVWAGSFGKSVRCTGDDNCPLCKSEDADVKRRRLKFYAKMVAYVPTATGADLQAVIWERPSGFADIDLKNLMVEYGDLSNYLFKIIKTGKGTDTRYNIMPVNMQSPVYSQPVYTTKDFSCLEGVDPTKILSKSIEQYNEAINPKPAEAVVEKVVVEEVAQNQTFIPQDNEVQMEEIKITNPTPSTTPVTQNPTTTVETPVTTTTSGVTRYKF